MLSIYAVNAQGKRILLAPPQSMLICIDEDVPADSLSAVFAEAINDELSLVYVYDGDDEIFRGVVDEQSVYAGDEVKTEILCRSMAALLVDNEACPGSYCNLSADILFLKYIEPLGFGGYTGAAGSQVASFNVDKGLSCFEVTAQFSRKIGARTPRVQGDVIHLEGLSSDKEVVFENTPESRYCFTGVEYNRLRCKLISDTCSKIRPCGGYDVVMENSEAKNRGIVRRRYINSVYDTESFLSRSRALFSTGNCDSESVVLWCNKGYTDLLGAGVTIKDKNGGELSGFYVSSLRFLLSDKGEQTKLILKKKEN